MSSVPHVLHKKASHCVTICNSPTTNCLDLIIPQGKHTEMGLSVQTFSLFTKWNFWPVQQIVQSSKIPQRSIPKRKHTLRNRFHGEANSVRKSFHADLRRGIFHWRNFENEKKWLIWRKQTSVEMKNEIGKVTIDRLTIFLIFMPWEYT